MGRPSGGYLLKVVGLKTLLKEALAVGDAEAEQAAKDAMLRFG